LQVELYTGALVDLPRAERHNALKQLGDAARLASKLQLGLGLAGGLGYRTLVEVVQAAPAAERIAIGRAALTRAMLVGLDRALRDLRALVA
jgi:pyridoxine 5-phosphate synthase